MNAPLTGLSLRAAVVAVLVAATVGLVFPYVFLRLGFGPNASLFSTLLGFVLLAPLSLGARRSSSMRLALHAAQVSGVAAAQTAFMGVALAAFDLLRVAPDAGFGARPSPALVFVWLAVVGVLGALLALPLRRHYLDDEKLAFAGAEVAAETILTLERGEARGATGGKRLALVLSLLGSAAMTALRFGPSPLAVGLGMLIGLRLAASMAAGSLGVTLLSALGFLDAGVSTVAPAAAMMIAGGATHVVLRGRALFRGLSRLRDETTKAKAPRVVLASGALLLAVLCVVDRVALGLPVSLTLASVALALPLLLVGTRVLGETNWAPARPSRPSPKPRSRRSSPDAWSCPWWAARSPAASPTGDST